MTIDLVKVVVTISRNGHTFRGTGYGGTYQIAKRKAKSSALAVAKQFEGDIRLIHESIAKFKEVNNL